MHHNVQIIPIPAFKDNYIWLIHNGLQAVAVDPGDAQPVIQTLKQLNLNLSGILITHHHQDHIAGVSALIKAYPDAVVYAPKLETYSFPHTPVEEDQLVDYDEHEVEVEQGQANGPNKRARTDGVAAPKKGN
jgi:hydroxyacylglutathione hydrolase